MVSVAYCLSLYMYAQPAASTHFICKLPDLGLCSWSSHSCRAVTLLGFLRAQSLSEYLHVRGSHQV